MKGNLTKRDWMEMAMHLREKLDESNARRDTFKVQNEDLDRKITILERKLGFYENPDAPPSQDSLLWKEEKREKRTEGNQEHKRPGGRMGHKCVSRKHKPD